MFGLPLDPSTAKTIATMRLDEEIAAARTRAMVRSARRARRRGSRTPAGRGS